MLRTMHCALVAFVALFVSGSFVFADPIIGDIGTPYAISSIAADGLRVSDKVFSDFTVTTNQSVGALAPGAGGISVTPQIIDGNVSLVFNGGWTALQNQIADTTILFKVTADQGSLIDDDLLRMDAFGADNGGMVSVSENVYLENPNLVSTTPISDKFVYYVNSGIEKLQDYQTFTPAQSIWVLKDIVASGGVAVGGIGHLSQFTQEFSQVPEPMTPALLAIGGGLLLARRKRA